MSSIFTKIINREIPSQIIAEDENFISFLDINPTKHGHTLVVPKLEIDKIYDQPDEILSKLLTFAKPICKAIEKATGCVRVSMLVYGLEVPHTHLHLIPLHEGMSVSDLANHISVTLEDLSQMQEKIIAELEV